MGGWGGYCRASASADYDRFGSVRNHLDEFFGMGKQASLILAYNAFCQQNGGNSSGFFKRLMDYQGVKDLPHELHGLEIESKLEVILEGSAGSREEPAATAVLDAVEFPPTSTARYIKDARNGVSEGKNAFFVLS